ncbi:MAG: hypothetical protein WBD55_08855 [Dehalococcoidia bacterium]
MPVRPYRKQDDRSAVLALLQDTRAIDSPSARLQVVDERGVTGAALWVRPDAGADPYLGSVIVTTDDGAGLPDPKGPVERWQQAYQLVAGCVEDALTQGFERGHLIIASEALRRHIERDFTFRIEPAGWDPRTGEPAQWRIDVDLNDALEQLRRAAPLAGR